MYLVLMWGISLLSVEENSQIQVDPRSAVSWAFCPILRFCLSLNNFQPLPFPLSLYFPIPSIPLSPFSVSLDRNFPRSHPTHLQGFSFNLYPSWHANSLLLSSQSVSSSVIFLMRKAAGESQHTWPSFCLSSCHRWPFIWIGHFFLLMVSLQHHDSDTWYLTE